MDKIEKIRQEIERRKKKNMYINLPMAIGRYYEDRDLLAFIDSLQQEQSSEKTCKVCGFYENNCPYIRGKFIPYPSKVCKDYTYSVIKEQEQSCEDLEEEVDRYVREQWDMLTSTDSTKSIVRRIARHFANWQKEQMLKDAVEGEVCKDHIVTEKPFYFYQSRLIELPDNLKEGDKVKIVIVKEDKE